MANALLEQHLDHGKLLFASLPSTGESPVEPGEEHTFTGSLMGKEAGKPIWSGGKGVTATAYFIPDRSFGSVC